MEDMNEDVMQEQEGELKSFVCKAEMQNVDSRCSVCGMPAMNSRTQDEIQDILNQSGF